MQLTSIKWTLALWLFSGFFSLSFASPKEGEPLSVQWFEPKVQATRTPGLIFVNLVGVTEPGASIQVDPKSIIVIQPTDVNNKLVPQVGETLVKSEGRGYFRLRLFMPNGLSQVPVLFRNAKGAQNTVLLTMRVDPKDVSLNVKVIRPTKTKIVTIVEKPPVQYNLAAGWSPILFHETISPAGFPDLNLPLNSYLALRVSGFAKSTKWWWLFDYQMANSAAPSALDDKHVISGNANLQALSTGGKYRLNDGANELWLGLDVDARFFPLPAISSANEISLIDMKLFRLGLGVNYLIPTESCDYSASIFYREPIAIKVGSGEMAFRSKYSVGLGGEVNWQLGDKWSLGTSAEVEMSSFSYEYNNSPLAIANKGSGAWTVFQLLLQANYNFGSKRKASGNH